MSDRPVPPDDVCPECGCAMTACPDTPAPSDPDAYNARLTELYTAEAVQPPRFYSAAEMLAPEAPPLNGARCPNPECTVRALGGILTPKGLRTAELGTRYPDDP